MRQVSLSSTDECAVWQSGLFICNGFDTEDAPLVGGQGLCGVFDQEFAFGCAQASAGGRAGRRWCLVLCTGSKHSVEGLLCLGGEELLEAETESGYLRGFGVLWI